jgi:citrate lyase beta subunit
MPTELPDALVAANREFARTHPGESGLRQPVHMMVGGAHLFKRDVCAHMGRLAERALAEYAPDPATLAFATGIPSRLAETVYDRVTDKLRREPVEDFHIDFEDGYGVRTDQEEDAAADHCAGEMAAAMKAGTLPAFSGIRIKPLNEECAARSLRTLSRFCERLPKIPDNFSVVLPKITVAEQVATLSNLLDNYGIPRMEIMIETAQSLLMLPELIDAARGKCIAAHFGPYDYTASLGIARQHILHPVCDWARAMMQAQTAGRGLRLSDGPTNVMPVALYRAASITGREAAENRATVHRGWKMHYDHVQHALTNGFYQGWDLHPAQLVARYAALYTFFLDGLDAASERLKNFIAKAAQSTMVGGVFDDAATGQGLLNYFLRAINCGAIAESDAPALTGVSLADLRAGSFAQIVAANARRISA